MPYAPKTDRYKDRRTRPQLKRPSAHQMGYGVIWRRIRMMHLADEPLCQRCGGAANVVDHIIPKAQGGTDDEENLQSLCESCHNRKTACEDGGGTFGR